MHIPPERMLDGALLDDKGLVRALFRFQQDVHRLLTADEIYQLTARFIFTHLPHVELVALHREDPIREGSWRQFYYSSRSTDLGREPGDLGAVMGLLWSEKKVLLLGADQLLQYRRMGGAARPLRSAVFAPLMNQDRMIGAVEAAAGKQLQQLGEYELDLVSVTAGILSARIVTLKLLEVVKEAEEKLRTENIFLKSVLRRDQDQDALVGVSPSMQKVKKQIDTVGPSDLPVLILGETGTGKELVARAIHSRSNRGKRIFAAVNCGTFSDTLLESELFGHVKGSFTGAVEDKKGLFEVADGGTLFLDEVGEIPFNLQVKLLRALQEGEIMSVGSTKAKRVDVRLVAATNKELLAEVQTGKFREDLYYRINTFQIDLPPLRERRDDIPGLADHFLKMFRKQMGKAEVGFSPKSIELLKTCSFPGNIRQLKNEIQRALLMAEEDGMIEPENFSPQIRVKAQADGCEEIRIGGRALKDIMDDYEIRVIRQALSDNGWNRSRTALLLGISRQAFMAKLSKYGIAPEAED